MKKITVIALSMAICIVCVGCGKNETENTNTNVNEVTQNTNIEENINLQEEFEDKEIEYIEGITDPVRIEETEEELRVNVKGNISSIYKCSGDIVVEWYEKYYFDTEELAQSFAMEQENQSNVNVSGDIVIVNVEIPEGTVMKKSDLVKTYSALKEVYENE